MDCLLEQGFPRITVLDLLETALAEPTIILHAFAIQIDLARHGLFGLDPHDVVERAICYISDMADIDRLLMYQPETFGSSWMTRDHSDGQSHAERESDEVKRIRTLHDAMVTMDRTLLPLRLNEALSELESNPEWYQHAFLRGGNRQLGIPDMTQVPIFQNSDAAMVAGRVFSMQPNLWRVFLSPFKDRIERQEFLTAHADNRPTERDWLIAFCEAALVLSTTCSPLKRAQIHSALEDYLSFLDPPTDPKP